MFSFVEKQQAKGVIYFKYKHNLKLCFLLVPPFILSIYFTIDPIIYGRLTGIDMMNPIVTLLV